MLRNDGASWNVGSTDGSSQRGAREGIPSRKGTPDGGIAMAMTKVKFAGAAAAVLAAGVLIAVAPGRAQQQPPPEAAGPGGDGARRDGPPMRGMPWMSGRMGGGMGMMGRGHRMCDER